LHIVVDAAQGRCDAAELQAWLVAGAMVILTGSKFYGAPTFAGAG
jgi:hypothetical protein